MAGRPLAPENYYRLPWNLADNAITWLEPTTKCNMNCEGCYREKGDHRPLDSVIKELEGIKQVRRTDGISIAGGEPLLYPDLLRLSKKVLAGVTSLQFSSISVHSKSFITNYNLYKIAVLCYSGPITFFWADKPWPDIKLTTIGNECCYRFLWKSS